MLLQPNDLESLLCEKIPMAKLMEIKVTKAEDLYLQLTLPLAINRNHKNTLFGGSLYSGAALACYGLFLSGLREAGIDSNEIVIAEGNIKYLLPVDHDATILATWPDPQARTIFFHNLKKKNKARILLSAEISTPKGVCANFNGQFVAKNN